MEKIQTNEVIVRIPPSVAADIRNDEIIDLLLAKALGKKDLYKREGLIRRSFSLPFCYV